MLDLPGLELASVRLLQLYLLQKGLEDCEQKGIMVKTNDLAPKPSPPKCTQSGFSMR
jgi:hypothetical protein